MIDAGAVNILYGSASGLTAAGNQFWTQDNPGILERAEAGDLFGSALATGDFDGDGFADLAVGVPFENVGSVSDAGAVNILYGSASGLTAAGNQFWAQDSPGITERCRGRRPLRIGARDGRLRQRRLRRPCGRRS